MLKVKNVNVNEYTIADSGRFGKALERTLTAKQNVKGAGKIDRYINGKRFEIKTGAGELNDINKAQFIIYVPVPLAHADGTINPYEQEGFVLTRDAFINALAIANAIRTKASTASYRNGTPTHDRTTIQTFWIRKSMKPHGKLYDRILDAMYDNCEMTLEELLEA